MSMVTVPKGRKFVLGPPLGEPKHGQCPCDQIRLNHKTHWICQRKHLPSGLESGGTPTPPEPARSTIVIAGLIRAC